MCGVQCVEFGVVRCVVLNRLFGVGEEVEVAHVGE